MSGMFDALTCLAVGCLLFPLGAWGRAHADSLVVQAIQGEERELRIAVLRRGALTCQVLSVVFTFVGFGLLAAR